VLARRQVDGFVFRGDDGLDELTTTTTTTVWSIVDGDVSEHRLDPANLGLAASSPEDLKGGDSAYNADVVRRVVAGEGGPVSDAVLLNAAAAIAAYEAAPGPVEERIADGLGRARHAVDSGAAEATLSTWVAAVAEIAA
jgi:anthranilate phosphoribosyltransferase